MSTAAVERELIQAALPACLFENPYRLVSLYDVLKFQADDFCRASSMIGQLYMDVKSGRTPQNSSWQAIGANLGVIEGHCRNLGLVATLAQLQKAKAAIEPSAVPPFNLSRYSEILIEIVARMVDELEGRKLYAVTLDKAQYLDSNQFAPIVADKFPDAIFDMDEAGKCFAFERPTACVYHLMRVTEYGLNYVSKVLAIKDPLGPNWDGIINFIDAELKKEYKDRKFKGNADFISHISTHLHAVKVAWRNRTMHIDKKHTVEEASEIYAATRGLMRYIAENTSKGDGLLSNIRAMIKR